MKKTSILLILSLLTIGTTTIHAQNQELDKLDTRLKSLINQGSFQAQSIQSTKNQPLKDAFQPVFDGKRVRVEIRLNDVNPETLKKLKEKGLHISTQFKGLVSGSITPDDLYALSGLASVSTIYPYYPPHLRSIRGEGVETLRADLVHNGTPPYDGSGVKIGILSDSFGLVSSATPIIEDLDGDGIMEITGTDSQLSGDLPPVVELLEDGFGDPIDYSDEGRGMAELIYETAPGSELAFHSAFNGLSGFAQGIIALATAGCNVIVDDVIYFAQPFYQDGEVSQAIIEVEENYDVVYLTAHGNSSARAIDGVFRDIDPEYDDDPYKKIPSGNNLHQWNSGIGAPRALLPITLDPGERTIISMNWENPYGGTLGHGATTDYDLYILSEDEFWLDTIISYSDNSQGFPDSPFGDPLEIVSVANDGDSIQTAYLAINKHHGPDVNFKLLFFGDDVTISPLIRSTDASMMSGHNKTDKALSIASVNYLEVLSEGYAQADPRTIEPAIYSSKGGYASIFFSPDGELYENPIINFKPDFASVDGTNTSFFYSDSGFDEDDLPNFFGTSAAAPHAAAIAAMMRQANPSLNAEDIRNLMREHSTDIHLPGIDAYTGYGLLYADNAIAAIPDKIEPTPTPTPIATQTPTPTPTATPTPVIPLDKVFITDQLDSAVDLSNGEDRDEADDRVLAIRWNLSHSDVDSYHVYVSVDGGKTQFLGSTVDSENNYLEWNESNSLIKNVWRDGPQFGHRYQFFVYVITESGSPHHYGPFTHAGPVEFKETE